MSEKDEAIQRFGPDAKHWSELEASNWVVVGKIPDRTKRGIWVNDVLRTADVKTWDNNALLDWLDGSIKTHPDLIDQDIWTEIRRRNKLPGNWVNDDVKKYIQTGIPPKEVAPGVLENDRIRNEKSIEQLTWTDIRLALTDTVPHTFSKPDLYGEIRKRLSLTSSFPEERLLKSIPTIEGDRSMNDALLISRLNEYKKARKEAQPGQKITIETHANAQKVFFDTLMSVLSRDAVTFTQGFNTMLDFINKEYHGLFDERSANLGINKSSLSTENKHTLTDILNLMIETREPRGRKAKARMYKLDTILRFVRVEQRRQNLIQFYTLE